MNRFKCTVETDTGTATWYLYARHIDQAWYRAQAALSGTEYQGRYRYGTLQVETACKYVGRSDRGWPAG